MEHLRACDPPYANTKIQSAHNKAHDKIPDIHLASEYTDEIDAKTTSPAQYCGWLFRDNVQYLEPRFTVDILNSKGWIPPAPELGGRLGG
jgi:hypothetical protein